MNALNVCFPSIADIAAEPSLTHHTDVLRTRTKSLLGVYAACSGVGLIGLYLVRPEWSAVLWPVTILNALICGYAYQRVHSEKVGGSTA